MEGAASRVKRLHDAANARSAQILRPDSADKVPQNCRSLFVDASRERPDLSSRLAMTVARRAGTLTYDGANTASRPPLRREAHMSISVQQHLPSLRALRASDERLLAEELRVLATPRPGGENRGPRETERDTRRARVRGFVSADRGCAAHLLRCHAVALVLT